MGVVMTGLSQNAIEALAQLFVTGPTWDGNLVSKDGRTELVRMGLAEKIDGGWNYLTRDGVEVAANWATGVCKMSGDQNLTKL